MSSTETVVFSQDRIIPFFNLSLLNCSRLPSFLMTTRFTFSTRSYVVNLFSHFVQFRLLLIVSRSSESLVSTTSVSVDPQYGHFMIFLPRANSQSSGTCAL